MSTEPLSDGFLASKCDHNIVDGVCELCGFTTKAAAAARREKMIADVLAEDQPEPDSESTAGVLPEESEPAKEQPEQEEITPEAPAEPDSVNNVETASDYVSDPQTILDTRKEEI